MSMAHTTKAMDIKQQVALPDNSERMNEAVVTPMQNEVTIGEESHIDTGASQSQIVTRIPQMDEDLEMANTGHQEALPDPLVPPSAVNNITSTDTAPPNKQFRMLGAFLAHDDLLLYLTTQHMEPRELMKLYRISKPFHYIVNSNLTTYVYSSARRWARLTHFRPGNENLSKYMAGDMKSGGRYACGTEPTTPGICSPFDITTIFPHHLYRDLCMPDPTLRTLDRVNEKSKQYSNKPTAYDARGFPVQQRRHVPTFRYLRFLLFRAKTIQSIISCLLADGHRLPIPLAPSVIAKVWFMMDIPFNRVRLAAMRNEKMWSNTDLYIAQLFFVKLDMCFTDPVDGLGEMALRRMLLAQRTLSKLDNVLKREDGRNIIEILRLWAVVKYRPSKEHAEAGYTILGIPPEELGMLGVEGWGIPLSQPNTHGIPSDPYARNKMLRPDKLVTGEAFRRQLPLHYKVLDMVTYGYIDRKTGMNLPKNEEARQKWLHEERTRGFVRACNMDGDDDAKLAAARAAAGLEDDDEVVVGLDINGGDEMDEAEDETGDEVPDDGDEDVDMGGM